MKMRYVFIVFALVFCVSRTSANHLLSEQTVTLYPPQDKATKKNNEGKACFSFLYGALKEDAYGKWNLGYGFMAINNEDWFIISTDREDRSVIKDLGELNWSDSFKIPTLQPLPVLADGEQRHITVDASADTGKIWEKTTTIHAKVMLGHIYVVHVKDQASDFYALFRVEDFEQNTYCTISWRTIPTPD